MKEVLITTFTYPPQQNGVAEVVCAHAEGLARRGYRVTVATARDDRRAPPGPTDQPHVLSFAVSGSANPRVGCHGEVRAYQDAVAAFDGDVIFCHCWQIWSTDLAVAAFPRSRARKVMVSHGFNAHILPPGLRFPRGFLTWIAWQPYVRRLPAMMRMFDHLVFLSGTSMAAHFHDRRVADRIGLTAWTAIPNGADPRSFSDAPCDFRARHGIGEGPLLLHVGYYDPVKNQALALRAFAGLARGDATLVLIGPDLNAYARRLQGEWKQRGAPGGVLFLDRLSKPEIRAAYHAADVLICSSVTETQPLAVLDAMAAGIPFVSTDVGSVSELPGGRIVRSAREMTNALRALLDHPEEKRRLADEGHSACLSTYNWEAILDRYEDLIAAVCGRR